MSKPKLGFCLTGSFCTFQAVIEQMKILSETYDILPIMSYHAYQLTPALEKRLNISRPSKRSAVKKSSTTCPPPSRSAPKR